MAGGISIGPRIGVQGEREFRAALREIIATSQKLGAEMDRLTAQFSKNDSAIERNRKEYNILSNEITRQGEAVERNTQLRDLAVKKYDEQVKAVQAFIASTKKTQEAYEKEQHDLKDLQSEYDRVGRNLKVLTEEFGEVHPYTMEAAEAYKTLGQSVSESQSRIDGFEKTLEEAPDKLADMNASMHRDGEFVQLWNKELTNADAKLFELQKNILLGANYIEEFGRNTEKSAYNIEKAGNAISAYSTEFGRTEAMYSNATSAVDIHSNKVAYLTSVIEKQKEIVAENTRIRDEAVATEQKQIGVYESVSGQLELANEMYGENSREAKTAALALEEVGERVKEAERNTATYNLELAKSQAELEDLERELALGVDYVEEFGRKTLDSSHNIEMSKSAIDQYKLGLEQTEAGYTRLTSAEKIHEDRVASLTSVISKQVDAVSETVRVREEAIATENAQRAEYQRLLQELDRVTNAYGENSKEAKAVAQALDEQKSLLRQAEKNTAQYNAEVTKSSTELIRLERELVKGTNYIEEFGRKSEESKRGIEKHEKALELLDSELEKQQSQYSKLEKYLRENYDRRTILNKKIEEEKQIIGENIRLHQEALRTEEKQRKEYERLIAELEKAKKEYGEDSNQVRALNEAVDEQAKLVHEASQNTAEYAQKINEARTAHSEMQKELKESSGFATMTKMMVDAGEKIEEFGTLMSKYVTAPLAALGTYAVKSASDFEDAMAKVYTIAIDSTEPMEKMHDELIALSNETGFDLSDLGEAAYQTVSASVDAADAIEFLTQATKLARAGFTSTEKSVDILSTIMNSYGKEVYDTAYLSDLLIKTQNDGKLVVDELAHSIGTVVPMAKNYGVGIEQIAAAYATMTKQGTSAEQATTFMRALFTELEKNGKGVSKILEDETGKSFAKLMKSGWSLADVLEVLYTKTDKDSEAYQLLFKNVRSGNAAASLAAQGFGVLRSELDAMNNVAGQTEKALAVLETPSLRARRAVNRLKNSAEDLGETLMDIGMPAFEGITDKVTELTEGFVKLQPETKRVIAKGIGLAAAIGPVATVTGKLVGYIGALMAGTGSVIPLIVGLTAGFVGMYTAAEAAAIEERHMREEQWGLSEDTKQLIEDVNGLKTAHNEFKVSMQAETTELLNTSAKAQELALQYDALLDSEGNVKKGNEELADYLMTELATALGINKEDLQNLVAEHGNLSKSIQQTIADYEKEAYASIYKQELNEATERLVKSQMAEKDLVEQQDQAYVNLRATAHEMQLAKDAITDAEAKGIPVTEEMYQAYDDASKNWDIAKQAVDNLDGAITESRTNQQEAKKDVDTYSAALKDLAGESDETAEQIKSDAKESETSVKNAVDNSVSKMTAAKWDAYKSGENFARGYANGIDDYAYLSASAASNMGANATKLLKISQHEKSPSKITRQSGRYFGEGYALGMEDRFPMVNAMAEKMGTMATDSLAYGSYLPEGAIGGTYSSSKTVNAPISLNVTVNGSVDDPDSFAKDIANRLTNLINRESEVFA